MHRWFYLLLLFNTAYSTLMSNEKGVHYSVSGLTQNFIQE